MLTLSSRETVTKDEYEQFVMGYLNSRRTESPKSTLRRVTSIKTFARWAWEMTVLSDFTTPTPARPMPHPLPNGMDGITAMLNCCVNEDQTALVALQGFFALRISEARAVRAIHFDETAMNLSIRGKGDKVRVLPYGISTITLILDQYQRSLLTGEPLVRLSDSGARAAIKSIAARAGIPGNVSSHDLRATRLTDLFTRTKDIRIVQEFAGHSSVTQTQIYILEDREAMRLAVS